MQPECRADRMKVCDDIETGAGWTVSSARSKLDGIQLLYEAEIRRQGAKRPMMRLMRCRGPAT